MSSSRDLDAYAADYAQLPYEPLQAATRRERVLAQIGRRAPGVLVEVGCGRSPIFEDVLGARIVVVEPAAPFAAAARVAAAGRPEVSIIERGVEDVGPEDIGTAVDMVLVSGLLHEVPSPQRVLAAVRRWCDGSTVVHVNVPNALSLHRRLAVAMGISTAPGELSAQQRVLQQRVFYDASTLLTEVQRAGFEVVDRGGIALKPFTHAQMQHLVDTGFLTPELLGGLARLGEQHPDLASEIWVDLRPSGDVVP